MSLLFVPLFLLLLLSPLLAVYGIWLLLGPWIIVHCCSFMYFWLRALAFRLLDVSLSQLFHSFLHSKFLLLSLLNLFLDVWLSFSSTYWFDDLNLLLYRLLLEYQLTSLASELLFLESFESRMRALLLFIELSNLLLEPHNLLKKLLPPLFFGCSLKNLPDLFDIPLFLLKFLLISFTLFVKRFDLLLPLLLT